MALDLEPFIFVLCDTLNGYQPKSFFEYSIAPNKYVETPKNIPDGYLHWIHMFDDITLLTVNVLYPKNPQKGKSMTILYRGPYNRGEKWEKIGWTEGQEGLFSHEIITRLTMDGERVNEIEKTAFILYENIEDLDHIKHIDKDDIVEL